MDDIEEFMVHWVLIERYHEGGADGEYFDPATATKVFYDDTTKRIRNANGVEVVSSASVFCPKDTPPVPLGSRVTAPAVFHSRVSTVLSSSVRDLDGQMEMPEHIQLMLE